jgi:hypothetical protein
MSNTRIATAARTVLFASIWLFAGLIGVGSASAATCTGNGPAFTLTQGTPDAILGVGCYDGNDKNTVGGGTYFGISGWVLGGATDDASGTHLASISILGVGAPTGNETWSVSGNLYQYMMVALKQADYFALFQLDTTKGLAGLWGTIGPGGSIDGLSHGSIWYAGKLTAVPLPAGVILLGSALAGFGLLRRRGRVSVKA